MFSSVSSKPSNSGAAHFYKVKVKLACVDLGLLKDFQKALRVFLGDKASYTFISLPHKKSLKTVLRSPHVNKKSREHFELKVYKSQFIINKPSLSCVVELLKVLKSWSGGEYTISFRERFGDAKEN